MFWILLARIIVFAVFDDVLLLLFFLVVGSPSQAWISLASMLIYISAYCLLRRRWNRLAVGVMWTEIFVHAAAGTVLAGWASGYHYYLLMFVPTIIVSAPRRKALWMLAVLWSFYLGLLLAMHTMTPLEPIGHRALLALQAFNASVLFAMVTYFTFMYRRLARSAEEKLNLLATTDSLTGLFNRRYASEMATHEAKQGGRTSRPLSFILADIDHFKAINDQYGHDGGDAVLVAVSKALSSVTRAQDVLARWGGEEFLIMLPDTSREGAAELAGRIHHMMQTLRPQVGAHQIQVTLTMGISTQQRNESYSAILARADQALYSGKHSGRNCVRLDSGCSQAA